MKTITHTYNLYDFDELSKEVQEKVVSKNYGLNVEDVNWWEYIEVDNIAKKYGLSVDITDIAFDLYRYECHFSKIEIVDVPAFCKLSTVDCSDSLKEELSIQVRHYGGGCSGNFICWCDSIVDDYMYNALQSTLKSFLNEVLKCLKQTSDNLTSEEAIIETIKANEYTFRVDGTMENE